ncbi:MAG: right-handed parallel beta-helix repeat-containing protein, partial [Planctomycetota bacterium]
MDRKRNPRTGMVMVVFGVVVVGLAVVGTAGGETIYVDGSASGSNNGSSWADAYNYLQDALADANSRGVPVEIWVAAGRYTPDSNSADPDGSGDRTATFQLINGVAIYGGFPAGGGIWEDRDPNFYETVLSGDPAGDDDLVIEPGPGGGIPGENCAEAGPINRGETVYNNIGSTADGPGDCTVYNDIWYVYTAEFTGSYKAVLVAISGDYSPRLAVYEGTTCPPTVLMACGNRSVLFNVTEGTDCLIRVGSQFSYSEGYGTITITREVLGDNSYHVVTGSGTDANAVLDGFTITGGNSNEDGGGMYNYSGSPTVANCTFSGNSANRDGGGMFNRDDSNPTITNCTFIGNSANLNGGGISNQDSNPTITNCTFSGNSAVKNDGGGIGNERSSPTITNCTFSENSAGSWGGGIRISPPHLSNATISNCSFSGNSAGESGGGMYGGDMVTNCTFTGNSATAWGGGLCGGDMVTNCMFIGNSSWGGGGGTYGGGLFTNCTFIGNSANGFPSGAKLGYGGGAYGGGPFTNCTFIGNSAVDLGGGRYNGGGSRILTNCTFSGNSADDGGGMYNDSGSPTLTNCTFSGNSAAADSGGGMFNNSGGPELTNCIFWGNEAGGWLVEKNQIWGGTPHIYYTCVEGWTGAFGGAGNHGDDPLLVDADGADDIVGTEDDNLRLSAGSACIDAGVNAAVPEDIPDLDNDGNTTEPIPWDLDGRARFADGDYNDTIIVDMGAYEFGSTGVVVAELDMDEFWMYQGLPGQSNSDLTAGVSVTDD